MDKFNKKDMLMEISDSDIHPPYHNKFFVTLFTYKYSQDIIPVITTGGYNETCNHYLEHYNIKTGTNDSNRCLIILQEAIKHENIKIQNILYVKSTASPEIQAILNNKEMSLVYERSKLPILILKNDIKKILNAYHKGIKTIRLYFKKEDRYMFIDYKKLHLIEGKDTVFGKNSKLILNSVNVLCSYQNQNRFL